MGDPVNQDMILGELRGQVRELVHSVNNLSSKFDGLTREVIALGPLAVQIAALQADVQKLQETHNRQAGAATFGIAVLKSPLVGWIVGAAVTIWLLLGGKQT